jgi:hypothetical protein
MKPWKPLPPMPFTSTIPEILAAIENRWPEERLVNSDARDDVMTLIARVRELEAQLRIERENVVELEERLVLCQRTNDRMRERIGVKPPPWETKK